VVDELKPTNVAVVGALCLVRNSIGSDAYVADEIVRSRAGVRVRVGNTDAEGRMAMADVLCQVQRHLSVLKDQNRIQGEKNKRHFDELPTIDLGQQ